MKIAPRPWAPAALSALLAAVLYAITLGGTYIYDDAFLIPLDERVNHPNLWYQFWTRDWFNGGLDNLYRPLVSQSFGLQMWLHGDRPWAFHLVNILLHAGAAALVAELGRRLAGWRVGLFAGLLFACHPIHSEAVAGVVGRAELACTVGVLGAMVLFLKPRITTGRALAIFALSVVAMLSKEQGLLLPFLLAILIPVRQMLFPKPDTTAAEKHAERQAILLVFALTIWLAGGLMVLREEVLKLRFEWDRGFLNIAMQPLAKSPPVDRWLIPLSLPGRYFQLLVFPAKLSIDYGLIVIPSTISRSDPYLWLGGLVVAAWIIASILCLVRRRWIILLCLLAMALTYAPASNFLMIATIFGERLMYLPSAFFLILLSYYLARIPAPGGNVLLSVLLVLACLRTFTYIQRWNDRDAFYQYSLNQQPKSLQIHILLANAKYEKYQLNDARRIMDESESLYPDYWQAWKMSGLIDERMGDWSQAELDWKRAFDLYPSAELNDQWGKAMEMARKLRAATRK